MNANMLRLFSLHKIFKSTGASYLRSTHLLKNVARNLSVARQFNSSNISNLEEAFKKNETSIISSFLNKSASNVSKSCIFESEFRIILLYNKYLCASPVGEVEYAHCVRTCHMRGLKGCTDGSTSAAWEYADLLCNLYRNAGLKRCRHS